MTGFRNLLMAAGSGGVFEIDNSILFDIGDAEYLEFPNGNTPTNADIGTISFWFKRGQLGAARANDQCVFFHGTGGSVKLQGNFGGGTGTNADKIQIGNGHATRPATQFNNTDWQHLLIRVDSSQGTEADRQRIYINGSLVTSFSNASYPSQNADVFGNDSWLIAKYGSNTVNGYDGRIAEFVYLDGQSLDPSSFTSGTGTDIKPLNIIDQSLTFGNNGFYLPFTNSAGLGQDYSGTSSTTVVQKNTYNAGSEINEGDLAANPITAIKFVPIVSGTVSKIELNASARGFSGVTVRLETDGGSGNAPSGTLVTNGEVTGITSSGAGLKTATFSTPPSVTAGTTYWIGLRGDTGTWGLQHDVSGSGGALGLYQGSTQGYYSGRGAGHYVYMNGNHFTPVNSPTQSTDTPTS
tara:strand:+ start:3231 stop:4457 length:1227 start_codon:yes stop_codon:yes gene_type:complete